MSKRHLGTGVLIVFCLVSIIQGIKLTRGQPQAFVHEPWKVKGPENAKVFIVEFSDYSCPFCAMVNPMLHELLDAFPNDLKLIFKHYPLEMHPRALPAAMAAECAGEQGKFWEYNDHLFGHVQNWHEVDRKKLNDRFTYYAREMGLDEGRFKACVESGSKRSVVLANRKEGQKFFVSGTPTLLLNGTRVLIKRKPEDLKKIIQAEIDKKK